MLCSVRCLCDSLFNVCNESGICDVESKDVVSVYVKWILLTAMGSCVLLG